MKYLFKLLAFIGLLLAAIAVTILSCLVDFILAPLWHLRLPKIWLSEGLWDKVWKLILISPLEWYKLQIKDEDEETTRFREEMLDLNLRSHVSNKKKEKENK